MAEIKFYLPYFTVIMLLTYPHICIWKTSLAGGSKESWAPPRETSKHDPYLSRRDLPSGEATLRHRAVKKRSQATTEQGPGNNSDPMRTLW